MVMNLAVHYSGSDESFCDADGDIIKAIFINQFAMLVISRSCSTVDMLLLAIPVFQYVSATKAKETRVFVEYRVNHAVSLKGDASPVSCGLKSSLSN